MPSGRSASRPGPAGLVEGVACPLLEPTVQGWHPPAFNVNSGQETWEQIVNSVVAASLLVSLWILDEWSQAGTPDLIDELQKTIFLLQVKGTAGFLLIFALMMIFQRAFLPRLLSESQNQDSWHNRPNLRLQGRRKRE